MTLLIEHLLVVLGALLVALAMILVLQPRRTPQAALAWILAFVVLPYLAVPLFLALGFRKHRRDLLPERFTALPPEGSPFQPAPPGPPAPAMLFRRLGAAPALTGNRLVLHRDAAMAQAELLALVAGAERQIDLLLYMLHDDDQGRALLRALSARAAQGIRVRLALDRLGTLLSHPKEALQRLRDAGGEVRFMQPFLALRRPGGPNLRNHRKLVLADNLRVWTGGRNVGAEYFDPPPEGWLDLSLTAEGPVVTSYAEVFAADWQAAGGGDDAPDAPPPFPPAPAGPDMVQLVAAGPDERRDVLHDGLVSAIHRANHRVWITTPYFVPTEALALALFTAARAGRDVRIFLPQTSNQWTADLARGSYLRYAAAAGCRIFRYQPGMMHAKAGLIDGWGWIGSANFDVRSMLLNFETTLVIHDGAALDGLEDWFSALLPGCTEGAQNTSLPRRLAEGVFRLGAPIL